MVCDFASYEPWIILTPIEQSIKRKIEVVGTPLKDWDIQIYRGVLTGCNDAFIISTEKRNEILANCQSEDERQRTEELIRPIVSIRLRTTCIIDFKLEATCSSWPKLGQVDPSWSVLPTCLAGVHGELHGCSRSRVSGAGHPPSIHVD